jgi:hypothetical protein
VGGGLANITPSYQDTYVDFRDETASLLFKAGGEDNIMPSAVIPSDLKHYRHTRSVNDYKKGFGHSHYGVKGRRSSATRSSGPLSTRWCDRVPKRRRVPLTLFTRACGCSESSKRRAEEVLGTSQQETTIE